LLILVGEKDRTTPPRLSQALFAASPLPPDRKRLILVAGAGHTDVMTRPLAIAAYRNFLTEPAR
jgi:pimeloyl-ACP methyl ester carboxylesterase